eukprot:6211234-Pleurochrysis_carterae.AAC.1
MNGLEAGVVINEDKQVLKTCMLSAHERACNVGVDETAWEGWLVQSRVVSMSCRVGFGARSAAFETAVR